MASIQKYNDRWRAVVRRTGFKVRSDIFGTKREAEKWAREIESAMDSAKYRDPTKDLKDTVRKLLERFRDEVAPARKGGRWDRIRIDYLLRTADFVEQRLDKIAPVHIKAWRDARLKKVTSATVNRDMNLISGIFTHAIKEWGIPLAENPVHLVKRPAGGDRARDRTWTDTEVQAFLAAAKHDPEKRPEHGYEYVSWAVLLALETAMRLGELCRATVADFHAPERYLYLADTKNGDPRKVPLSSKAVEILTWITAGRPSGEQVIPLAPGSLGTYYRERRKLAGLDRDLHFHDIRHTATTLISQKVSNVLELSAITGHRSLQSLKRYHNMRPADLAKKLG